MRPSGGASRWVRPCSSIGSNREVWVHLPLSRFRADRARAIDGIGALRGRRRTRHPTPSARYQPTVSDVDRRIIQRTEREARSMTNSDIARRLMTYARELEAEGGNVYRTRAYRAAAQTIERMERPVADLYAEKGR